MKYIKCYNTLDEFNLDKLNNKYPSLNYIIQSNSIDYTGYRDELILDESKINKFNSGYYKKLSIIRSISPDKWVTIVLPIDMEIPDTWDARDILNRSITDDNVITLNTTKVSSIKAGKSYLIKTTVQVTKIELDNVYVSNKLNNSHIEGVNFIGTYDLSKVPIDGYFLSNNSVYHAIEENVTLKGFRSYFMVDNFIECEGLDINLTLN